MASWLDDLLGYKDIIFNGIALARRSKLRLLGAGVTVEDNPNTGTTDVTISSGGGGGGGLSFAEVSDLDGPVTANTIARVDASADDAVVSRTAPQTFAAGDEFGVLVHGPLGTGGSVVISAGELGDGFILPDDVTGSEYTLTESGEGAYFKATAASTSSGKWQLYERSKAGGGAGEHGNLAGGSLHAVATTSTAGFMSSSDKTKLDGISSSAAALTSAAPAAVGAAAVVGVGTTAARSDHVHAHGNQAGGSLHSVATTETAGFMSAADKEKLDGISAGAGSGVALTSSVTPSAIGTAAIGSAETAARADHVHAHGTQAGGSLHAEATTSAAGFMSADDKTKLDGVSESATNTPLTSSAPAAVTRATAVVGVATAAARADHKHDVSTAVPVAVGTANGEGTASTLARSDHVHAHGDQAGGSLHAVATTSVAGFLSAADKAKLDGIAEEATALALTSSSPATITRATSVVGIATAAARADHKHDIATAAPSSVGTANDEGTSTSLARADHVHSHGNQAGGALHAVATTSVAGFMSSTDKSKLDGITASATNTPLSSTTPAAVGTAAVGVGTTAARADHVHAHGNQAGGSLHSVATTSVAGFMSSTDKTKLDGIASSATNTPLASAAPEGVGAAAADVGVATAAARADHVHQLNWSGTTPVNVHQTSGNVGTSNVPARSDHRHFHGNLAGGSLHDVATTSVAGFMSAADKVKLDDAATLSASAWKQPVRVATTANLAALSGLLTIDGVTLVAGDRVLVKNQTAASQNGIYVAASGAWSRATDADASADIVPGLHVRVTEGSSNDGVWSLSTTGTITLGTTSLTFEHAAVPIRRRIATSGPLRINGSTTATLQNDRTLSIEDATTSASGAMSAADKARLDHYELTPSVVTGNTTVEQGEHVIYESLSGNRTATLESPTGKNGTVIISVAQYNGWVLTIDVSGSADTWAIAEDDTHLVFRAINGRWRCVSLELSSTAPATIGSTLGSLDPGSSPIAARADHVHNHGNLSGGGLHSAATTSANGFMAAADKVRVNNQAYTPFRRTSSSGASVSPLPGEHHHWTAFNANGYIDLPSPASYPNGGTIILSVGAPGAFTMVATTTPGSDAGSVAALHNTTRGVTLSCTGSEWVIVGAYP